jgi:hypothetical protein
MKPMQRPSAAAVLSRAAAAGVAGTVVMTAFRKLIEMPITKRQDSYAPATPHHVRYSARRRRRRRAFQGVRQAVGYRDDGQRTKRLGVRRCR